MTKLYIEGGRRLEGTVMVQGAKNSILPILAASILPDGESVIENCPAISDTDVAIRILKGLGCSVSRESGVITVNSENINGYEIEDSLMRKMRSSIMFLGAIVAKTGRARISMPGGCELGPRPIDLHLKALEKLGAKIYDDRGYLECSCEGGLRGTEINLSFPSVGATENIMLAAATAKGTTVITNAAREPEIDDLKRFLNEMGAKISSDGGQMVIEGVKRLYPAVHRVIPDRIVASTYLAAIAATGGRGKLIGVEPMHFSSVISTLSDAGADVRWSNDTVEIRTNGRLKGIRNLRTMPYPGFPTDAQAPLMALLTCAKGDSVFVETIFENRFKHVNELIRMGAKITVQDRVAVVEGVQRLTGARVESTDLRGGAALVVAALAAEGRTEIDNVFHIDRGYEAIEEKLASLGADIKRI
ncbi:MAG: UDP-N-acetylglucosamine 1-carboxyvinyltransferase [Clostridia bacterium]|nr:UDP-N-acetylglucosamine 1-carboxyvinyltransferase [Clostridia bacterium]MBR2328231.1 UDP-N-acetylglucosamine 1-carboxyvinyltransferase [Clostridia bacterium]